MPDQFGDFTLNDKQRAQLKEWIAARPDPARCGTFGDRYSFLFTPTNVLTFVKVKDNVTGDVLDLSDSENW